LDEHIPVLHRSEILADLLDEGLSVAVTGTHGKSSTTGFIAQGLELLGFDPTFIGGAVVNPLGGNAKLGSGPVIGEVDESDGSLVRIPASVKVVLNLDDDHLPSMERWRTWLLRCTASYWVALTTVLLC